MTTLELTDAAFDREVLEAEKPVLVDFWAPWCGPCRMVAPVVEELARDYDGKVKVAKLNTDESAEIAVRYKISAIPTLLLFKNGRIVNMLVGVHPKAEIAKLLDAALAG